MSRGMSAEIFAAGIAFCEAIKKQENPDYRVIKECEFIDGEVWIKSDCDGWAQDIKPMPVLSLYDGFVPQDFIGLTETEAVQMVTVNIMEEIEKKCFEDLPF